MCPSRSHWDHDDVPQKVTLSNLVSPHWAACLPPVYLLRRCVGLHSHPSSSVRRENNSQPRAMGREYTEPRAVP